MRGQSLAPLVALGAVLFGCGADPIEESRALALQLESDTPPAVVRPITELSPVSCNTPDLSAISGNSLLFVDVSQSMASFTRGEQFREFDRVLERVGGTLGLSSVVEFGGSPTFKAAPFGFQLYDERTYRGENNPDFCLLQALLDSQDERTVYYLTDGVQSDAVQGGLGPNVERLRRWLDQGGGIGIMAFRGGFEGRLWSEELRRWLENVSSDERPFYVFVLTRNAADLAAALDQFDGVPGLPSKVVARFGGSGPVCGIQPVIAVYDQASNPTWFHLQRVVTAGLVGKDGEDIAELTCQPPPNATYDAVAGNASFVAAWEWRDKAYQARGGPPPGASLVAQRVTGSGVMIVGGIGEELPNTRHAFFAVDLVGEAAGLRDDLTALSTLSDALPATAGQTYRFAWLLNDLMNYDFSRVRPREHFYFSVTYR